jgi:hypothetical protein
MLKKGVFGIFLLLLSGCAISGSSAEETVALRAEQRMRALQELNFDKAYNYMSPGYKNAKDLERFKRDFAGANTLQSFYVGDVSCEEQVCQVMVIARYKIALTGRGQIGKTTEIERGSSQTWILHDGIWWYAKGS